MEAFVYHSGPACRIYLLADGSNCPAEEFLITAASYRNMEPLPSPKLNEQAKE